MAGPEDDLIGIPFPEHSSELLCSLNEQRQLGVLCDVTLRSHGLERPALMRSPWTPSSWPT
uniref:Uncharacterized protein n=1 Tax=Crocodylus porosus TaxID=8502 RepID=A0A7M4E2K4_CROPO